MSKADPLDTLRIRPFGMRISLFTQTAFIISLFLTCLCGPYCGASSGAMPSLDASEVSACCSSCPVENENVNEEPACDCCVMEQSNFVHELATYESHAFRTAHVERIIEWLMLPAQTDTHLLPVRIADTHNGPPPYLRFEMLLI